jgi:hypothetical protein
MRAVPSPAPAAPLPVSRSGPERPTPSNPTRRHWLLLGLYGALSLALYLALLRVVRDSTAAEPSYAGEVFPFIGLRTREQLPRIFPLASIQFLALVAGLYVLYGLALRSSFGLRSDRLALAIGGVGAAFLLVQTLGAAMLSTDVFAYTLYGRIAAIYHDNPYVRLAGKYPDDPYLPLTYNLPWPSWYGPLWTLISSWLALLGGERIGLTVLLFRLLAIGSALVVGVLVYLCLRRLAPERAVTGLLFALWNPLLVLESGLSGHNDAFMAALLLFGFWLALRGRPLLATVPLCLSVLVKFVFGLVLPFFALMVLWSLPDWRARGRYLVGSALLTAVVLGASLLAAQATGTMPVAEAASANTFYENNLHEQLFRALRRAFGEPAESVETPVHLIRWWAAAQNSTNLWSTAEPPAEAVGRVRTGAALLILAPGGRRRFWAYEPDSQVAGFVDKTSVEKIERPGWVNDRPDIWPWEENPVRGEAATEANRLLRGVCWGVFGAFWLNLAWRTRDRQRWLGAQALVVLAALWLVTTEIWPWYANWAVILAALIPRSRTALLAALVSATGLTLYVTLGFQERDWGWVYTYRSVPAFLLPLLLFGLILLFSRRVARRPATNQR